MTTTQTQYYGVAGGNLVIAIDEAQLRKQLPALLAGQPVPNPVQTAGVATPADEFVLAQIHGAPIVDMALESAKVDASDSDAKEQIKAIKDGFAEAGPISAKLSAAQAQATATIFIPYKFVEQAIRLGQFVSALKHPEEPAVPAGTNAPAAPEEASSSSAPAAMTQ